MAKSYTILIACHEDAQRMILENILTGEVFQVRTVKDSEEVINAVENHNPTLLIMDVEFPQSQMIGWELARKVRQKFKANLFIFLLIRSGHAYRYLEPEYKRLYDYILVMPVDLAEIWQGVKELIGVYPWGDQWDQQVARRILKSVGELSGT